MKGEYGLLTTYTCSYNLGFTQTYHYQALGNPESYMSCSQNSGLRLDIDFITAPNNSLRVPTWDPNCWEPPHAFATSLALQPRASEPPLINALQYLSKSRRANAGVVGDAGITLAFPPRAHGPLFLLGILGTKHHLVSGVRV